MPDTHAPTVSAAAGSLCFDVSIEDQIAHIQLKRPEKMNSMIREFWSELPAIVTEIDRKALARVIVISSTGKHFSSGMDLSVFAEGGVSQGEGDRHMAAEAFLHKVRALQDSFSALENARVPVLCAIQGGVIGGAVDMVTACDCRWASKDAFFQIQEINIGMTADVGTFPRLQRLLPEGVVRELAYTGRRLDAARAERLGLLNGVTETHEGAVGAAMDAAREIASKPPLAVAGSKSIINYGRDHSTADTLDRIGLWNASMLAPPQMMEAMMAKGEKRAPVYPDLKPIPDKPL